MKKRISAILLALAMLLATAHAMPSYQVMWMAAPWAGKNR